MTTLAHGIDIVETKRIAELLERHPDRFLARCFTADEIAYADSGKRRVEHLAVRFAAKEAVLKALGTGWAEGIAWTDVEVRRDPTGKPHIALHGQAKRTAESQGINTWLISLSHTENYATASAIALGPV